MTSASTIDTKTLTNGAHTFRIATAQGETTLDLSAPVTVSVANYGSNMAVDGITAIDSGLLGQIAVLFPTQSQDYTLNIKNRSGAIVLSYTGFGSRAQVVWDGKDSAGVEVPDGSYSADASSGGGSSSMGWITKAGREPEFIAVIMKETKNATLTQYYADHVRDQLQRIRDAAGMTYGITYREHEDVSPLVVQVLKRWIARSGRYFYFSGHGFSTLSNGDRPVLFGAKRRLSFANGGNEDNTVYVRPLVAGRQYKFVWMDACSTSGYSATEGQAGHMTSSPDSFWRVAFNVSAYDGAYIGWNGYCLLSVKGPANTIDSPWCSLSTFGIWRQKLWQLLADGQPVSNATTNADIATRGNDRYNPWTVIDGVPKRIQVTLDAQIP